VGEGPAATVLEPGGLPRGGPLEAASCRKGGEGARAGGAGLLGSPPSGATRAGGVLETGMLYCKNVIFKNIVLLDHHNFQF